MRHQFIALMLFAAVTLPACKDKQEECNKAKVVASEAWQAALGAVELERRALGERVAEAASAVDAASAEQSRLQSDAFAWGRTRGPPAAQFGPEAKAAWAEVRKAEGSVEAAVRKLESAQAAVAKHEDRLARIAKVRDLCTTKGAVAIRRGIDEAMEGVALSVEAVPAVELAREKSETAYRECVDVEP